jgi:hypothetical protein
VQLTQWWLISNIYSRKANSRNLGDNDTEPNIEIKAIYNLYEKFQLAPMGVLALSSAHVWPSTQHPVNNSGNFSAHVSCMCQDNPFWEKSKPRWKRQKKNMLIVRWVHSLFNIILLSLCEWVLKVALVLRFGPNHNFGLTLRLGPSCPHRALVWDQEKGSSGKRFESLKSRNFFRSNLFPANFFFQVHTDLLMTQRWQTYQWKAFSESGRIT